MRTALLVAAIFIPAMTLAPGLAGLQVSSPLQEAASSPAPRAMPAETPVIAAAAEASVAGKPVRDGDQASAPILADRLQDLGAAAPH